MTKKELRSKYKNLRQIHSEVSLDRMSLAIANNILKMNIWDKTYFHIFLPIIEKKEINTEFTLHVLQGKDKEIVVSKSDFETLELTHFLLTDHTKIIKNEYNIPEPITGLVVPTSKIDVVFVPLLAFDTFGNRVGYGKGFYDKFLSDCKPETIKIGLSFFEPEGFISDVSKNDIKMNFVVTPNQIYEW